MIIYIEEYRRARKHGTTVTPAYDAERLCVNWNPAVAVIPIPLPQAEPSMLLDWPDLQDGLGMVEFMAQTYALATQI